MCTIAFVGVGITRPQRNIEATLVESRVGWIVLLNAHVTCCCGATNAKNILVEIDDISMELIRGRIINVKTKHDAGDKRTNVDFIHSRMLRPQTRHVLPMSANNKKNDFFQIICSKCRFNLIKGTISNARQSIIHYDQHLILAGSYRARFFNCVNEKDNR